MSNVKHLLRGRASSVSSHSVSVSYPALPFVPSATISDPILQNPQPPWPTRPYTNRPRKTRRRKANAYAAYKARLHSLAPISEELEVGASESKFESINSPLSPSNQEFKTSSASLPPSQYPFQLRVQDASTLKGFGSLIYEGLIATKSKLNIYESLFPPLQYADLASSPQSGPRATLSYLSAAKSLSEEEAEYLSPVMLETPSPNRYSVKTPYPPLRRRPCFSSTVPRFSSVRLERNSNPTADLASVLRGRGMPDMSIYQSMRSVNQSQSCRSGSGSSQTSCYSRHPASFSCVRPAMYQYLEAGT